MRSDALFSRVFWVVPRVVFIGIVGWHLGLAGRGRVLTTRPPNSSPPRQRRIVAIRRKNLQTAQPVQETDKKEAILRYLVACSSLGRRGSRVQPYLGQRPSHERRAP
jgi:hypothetical protein